MTAFTDLDLNFVAHPLTGDVTVLSDIGAIKASIAHLVQTNFGDRPFHPEIDGKVGRLLFEMADQQLVKVIRDAIMTTISGYEPRARIIDIIIDIISDSNSVAISIQFAMLGTSNTSSLTLSLDRT